MRRLLLGLLPLLLAGLPARYLVQDASSRAFGHPLPGLPEEALEAFRLGEKTGDPLQMYLADIFTLPASLAGLPGMSLPAGLGAHGMPVGLQLIANYFAEGRLLHAAHAFQQASDWHLRRPQEAAR